MAGPDEGNGSTKEIGMHPETSCSHELPDQGLRDAPGDPVFHESVVKWIHEAFMMILAEVMGCWRQHGSGDCRLIGQSWAAVRSPCLRRRREASGNQAATQETVSAVSPGRTQRTTTIPTAVERDSRHGGLASHWRVAICCQGRSSFPCRSVRFATSLADR